MKRVLIISLAVLATLGSVSPAAPITDWQADPGVIGNWFDSANWTYGVPTANHQAFIDNDGTAGIGSGHALAQYLNIGTSQTGNVIQSGGTTQISRALSLGGKADSAGTYTLLGGELSAGAIYIGRGLGSGDFTQIGGTNTVRSLLKVGDLPRGASLSDLNSSLGTYKLIGGQLLSRQTDVGTTGHGQFIQTGGLHSVDGMLRIGGPSMWAPNPFFPVELEPLRLDSIEAVAKEPLVAPAVKPIHIPRPIPSKGLYVLNGGKLAAQQEQINRTGTMIQTGGSNEVTYLAVHRGGRYNYLGGSLEIGAGFDLDGVLDFGGNNRHLAIDSGLLNFARGSLLNSENTSITAGRDSLTIFANDFDPYTQLKHFSSQGLVHFAGNDLRLASDQGFTGWGTIHDHVDTHGWIRAADDGRIDLRKGLFVHEGRVDLGRGKLTVRNRRSGIADGTLRAGSMAIGSPFLLATAYPIDDVPSIAEIAQASDVTPVPIWWPMFRQTGGSVNLSGSLNVNNGAYLLRDGEFAANNVNIGWGRRYPYFWPHTAEDIEPYPYPYPYPHKARAAFIQTGGTSEVRGTLRVGGYLPLLIAHAEEIPLAKALLPEYTEYSEMATVDLNDVHPLPWPVPRTASYYLAGGSLSAGSVQIGGYGRAMLTQTGGELKVRNLLSIRGRDASYTIYGGSLEAKSLSVGTRLSSNQIPPYPHRWGGTLAIRDADADIRVSQRLSFGYGSTLTAVPGSSIHMTGPSSAVEILSTDAEALAGLNNLSLIFEGGDDSWATLEVGGEDMGFTMEGFFENFALDTLQIGSESDVAYVQLVDLFDNQLAWEGSEALYVETLIVGDNSFLNLNGLHIYYQYGIFGEGTILTGGGLTLMATPEPATLAVLLFGGLALLLLGGRSKRALNTVSGRSLGASSANCD